MEKNSKPLATAIALYGVLPPDFLKGASTEDLKSTIKEAEAFLAKGGSLDEEAPAALKALRAELAGRS